MIFYLKVNRLIDYTIRNLQTWIRAIGLFENSYVYVLCDNDALSERILNEVDFNGLSWQFLKSCRDERYLKLVENISVAKWHNAAYAHLTPFIHASENAYTEGYWNIDADDTLICASPEHQKEILETAREYAETHNIDLFSLDMWRSRSYGMHWSFGITYTNGNVNWLDVMKKHQSCKDGSRYFMNGNHPKNIDEYFTYIKAIESDVKIETFCIDNLLFVHYSDDFIMNPITSGVYRWSEGMLEFPIIKYVYGINSLGDIAIAEDVVRLDIGLEKSEGGWSLARLAPYSIEATNIIEAKEYEELRKTIAQRQLKNNVEAIITKLKKASVVSIFGFGIYTNLLIYILRSHEIEPLGIMDNAQFKWGKLVDGVCVCDPEILNERKDKDDLVVLIDVRHYEAIKKQLAEYQIPEDNVFVVIDWSVGNK